MYIIAGFLVCEFLYYEKHPVTISRNVHDRTHVATIMPNSNNEFTNIWVNTEQYYYNIVTNTDIKNNFINYILLSSTGEENIKIIM